MIDENLFWAREFAGDVKRRQWSLDVALSGAERGVGASLDGGDVFKRQQKIRMPQSTAKLAVGDDLQPDVFLHPHHLSDGRVFHLRQLGAGHFALA